MPVHPYPMLRRLHSNTDAVAASELALLLPMLVTLLLGMIDASLWVVSRATVERASRSGAEYAVAKGFNSGGIVSEVTGSTATHGAYLSAISASPQPSKWCGCPAPNPAAGVTPANCGSTCSSGLEAGTYVTVSAKASHNFTMPWPGLANPETISASTTVRIN